MDDKDVITALAALAQNTRLGCFRYLIAREPEGVPAGDLARQLGVPQNTMSAHLATMTNAGLLVAERQGRSIFYRVDLEAFRRIVLHLLQDCCGGNEGLCAPLIADLAMECRSCPPKSQASGSERDEHD
ncbi:helix-turn-helix transcriptional regulator [Martelella alba]|uniref:Helix-turn-helix transcriptional regulator n=1 Tax=Martelella alba TaxID=2590451 RepID=A0A506UIY4_9HYPH|nr:metalloregulator ArsR/SmtB family transcription factor [Martelella alba]TPW33258.1 helix-turn-helix transcriptional regulator [Martelella alba]